MVQRIQARSGKVAVDPESDEIPAVPNLLQMDGLTGAVGPLEAMHCQTDTAQATRNKGADYILTVQRQSAQFA